MLSAALKCRQRKKAWLAQLQAKVEYLGNENERLSQALMAAREEITRLSALVGTPQAGTVTVVPNNSVNGINVNGMSSSHGHNSHSSSRNGGSNSQDPPVSVAVSLGGPGKSASAIVSGGRSYGY